MKALKSIVIAAIIAAVSGFAQAQRTEQPVEQNGRVAKPAGMQRTIVPSNAGAIDVARVQRRGPSHGQAVALKNNLVTERSVTLYGRS